MEQIEMLDLPVEFGGVSIGDLTGRLGVKMSRSSVSLEDADHSLCGMRVTGRVKLAPKNTDPNQKQFDGMNGDFELAGAFDIKSIRASPEEITCGLTFNLKSIKVEDLAKFAKRSGRLVVEGTEALPDGEGEGDDEHEEHEEPRARKPSRRQKTLSEDGDAGAAMPLGILAQYGLTRKKLTALEDAAGGDTVGHLETLIRTNEWWHRDVKGFGEEWITRTTDALVAFRKDHPVPDGDAKTIFEQGAKK